MGIAEPVKIFLASSSELETDRREFEILVNRKNKAWRERGVFLELVVWEDFLDAMSRTRLQAEYNRAIEGCDLFVMLYHTKVGKYTAEEFETAFRQFQATNRPFIFVYFKGVPVDPDSLDPEDLASVQAFKKKLDELGHFHTKYSNVEGLQLHFERQLDKLAANGFIEFHPDRDDDRRPKAGDIYQATLHGDGAVAQGRGAQAVGRGGVLVGRDNHGSINTGTQTRIDTGGGSYVGGSVNTDGGAWIGGGVNTGGGSFAGRDSTTANTNTNTTTSTITTTTGVSPHDLEPLFATLLAAVAAQAPAGAQPAAVQQVEALKAEVRKGSKAEDGRMAKLIDGIVGLVPGAVGTVVGIFTSPVLAGLAGPVTKYVLGRLKGE